MGKKVDGIMKDSSALPAERGCRACLGFGVEIKAGKDKVCQFCEGRGWVLPVECCSCGRPAGELVNKDGKTFALCGRPECGTKFNKGHLSEFEELGVKRVSVDEACDFDKWDGCG